MSFLFTGSGKGVQHDSCTRTGFQQMEAVMSARFHGHIMAEDNTPDNHIVWKVRVVDPTCYFNGQKLVVASTHGGITLARGLIVSFEIGFLNDTGGKRVARAVDVSLAQESPVENAIAHQIYEAILQQIENSGQKDWSNLSIHLTIHNEGGEPKLDIHNVEIT